MNLLIDIGNTNLHWALHHEQGLGATDFVRHGGALPLDLLAAWETMESPQRVLVSNVGGAAVEAALGRAVRAYWGLVPERVATRADGLGVRVAYDEPSRLGVDRWLGLVAARRLVAGASLVVDAGTAATFDLLLGDGEHLGGLIVPGVQMMRDALLAGTHIPRVEPEPSADPWARDTGSAVASGSLHALAALTADLYDRLSARLPTGLQGCPAEPPTILLAGGDAPKLAPLLGRPFRSVPDLVLLGLARLAEEGG